MTICRDTVDAGFEGVIQIFYQHVQEEEHKVTEQAKLMKVAPDLCPTDGLGNGKQITARQVKNSKLVFVPMHGWEDKGNQIAGEESKKRVSFGFTGAYTFFWNDVDANHAKITSNTKCLDTQEQGRPLSRPERIGVLRT